MLQQRPETTKWTRKKSPATIPEGRSNNSTDPTTDFWVASPQ